jgi:hypothetical protein
MYIQIIFKLSLVLDTEKFSKLLNKAQDKIETSDENEYADRSIASKGIVIIYRDSQYKKKVKLIVNPAQVQDGDEPDPEKLIRKLEKRVSDYFDSKYGLDDFDLTGICLTTDINVGDHWKVTAYLKILQRIGKVKGFSPSKDSRFDDEISFCLDGNSNGIKFKAYELNDNKKIIRFEVCLTTMDVIRSCFNETSTSKLILCMVVRGEDIFMDTFRHIVPVGDYYKKGKAEKLIYERIKDARMRIKMLRLVTLIPVKKSLLLAQKALNARYSKKIREIMNTFEGIKVSPITISKRHDVKKLECLYSYLLN